MIASRLISRVATVGAATVMTSTNSGETASDTSGICRSGGAGRGAQQQQKKFLIFRLITAQPPQQPHAATSTAGETSTDISGSSAGGAGGGTQQQQQQKFFILCLSISQPPQQPQHASQQHPLSGSTGWGMEDGGLGCLSTLDFLYCLSCRLGM